MKARDHMNELNIDGRPAITMILKRIQMCVLASIEVA
jgi:hypothetical protein